MKHDFISLEKYKICLKDILLPNLSERGVRKVFFTALLLLIIGISFNVYTPFILKRIIDSLSNNNGEKISFLFISYGFVWIISQICVHIRALLTSKLEQRIVYVLGLKVLSHLYTLPHQYLINQKSGTLTNVIRRAQRNIPPIILGIFFHAIPTIVEFLLVIALVFKLYPPIYSLVLALTLISFFLYTVVFVKGVLKKRQVANDVDAEVDGTVTDWLSNHELINTFGQRLLAFNLFQSELKRREKAEINFIRNYTYTNICQSLILGLGLALMTFLVGKAVAKGNFTVGDFILFNGYILQLITPVSLLGHITQDIKKALIDMKDVMDILLVKNDITEASNPIYLTSNHFSLEFKDVTFKYNNENILENVCFKINAGETFVIVGQSGIGKSTIAKLILRLYEPVLGKIFINGIDLKDIAFSSLYKIVSWVPQEAPLFNDSIKNNLKFVCPEATLEEIETALCRAQLHNFLKSLPDGIDTNIGDRGLRLSGGEKQRISLARVFLKQPKICIFDEPTSFLDKETEIIIQENIKAYLPDTTKIIITHRPFMTNETSIVFKHSRRMNHA